MTRRKIVTRYTGDRGTAHKRIAKGTIAARPGFVYVVFTTGLLKDGALELPTSELKYRGQYIDRLPEAEYLSEDR